MDNALMFASKEVFLRGFAVLVISFMFTACSSAPIANRPSAMTKTRLSLQIFEALNSLPLKKQESRTSITIRAYDIYCRIQPPKGDFSCELFNKAAGENDRKIIKVPPSIAERFNVLFDLPIEKGDSGFVTPYVQCQVEKQKPHDPICFVATEVDFEKP